MFKELDKYIISDEPDISDRFGSNPDILNKVNVVNSQAEKLIWNKLKRRHVLLKSYSLNEEAFDRFETLEFRDRYQLATKRLKELIQENERIILTWFAAQHTLLTDYRTFTENWLDFFYPSVDDLIVINYEWDWIMYFAHYEYLQFGSGLKLTKAGGV